MAELGSEDDDDIHTHDGPAFYRRRLDEAIEHVREYDGRTRPTDQIDGDLYNQAEEDTPEIVEGDPLIQSSRWNSRRLTSRDALPIKLGTPLFPGRVDAQRVTVQQSKQQVSMQLDNHQLKQRQSSGQWNDSPG